MKKLAIKFYGAVDAPRYASGGLRECSFSPQEWALLIRGVKRFLAALALVLVFAIFQNLANL
nr:MAG TPA: hypothetical protein [Caudoviricetes sp.]